uniref:Tropomyosin n=1 Tax=Ditylenchus dipsaci TaxID=166011 RepID=A0A915ELF0_9BILA
MAERASAAALIGSACFSTYFNQASSPGAYSPIIIFLSTSQPTETTKNGRHQEEDAGYEDREGQCSGPSRCRRGESAPDHRKMERVEEELRDTQKKMMQTENDLDKAQEDLAAANVKLEEKEKALQEAEAEVASLNRRTTLIDEELERAEERLKIATEKMEEASANCDESERVRKVMENRSFQDEERANQIEQELKESQNLAEELTENTTRLPERAEAGENKIVELEEELRVVGNNLKSLEVSEEKALHERMPMKSRSALCLPDSRRLRLALEDELVHEKERYKNISEELDQTFQELSGY